MPRSSNWSTALDAALGRLTERDVPGVAAAVVSADGRIRFACAGVGDLATRRPTTPDTVHLWFSMTKIVTATAVMQLVERGALRLDDRVDSFLPSFPVPRAGWPPVEVRHLLSHSSGIANPLPVRWVHRADAPGRDPREFAADLLARHGKLRSPAGSRAAYSNLGYVALGELIAAVAGRPYEDYVHSEILDPLGMQRTGFAYEPSADGDVATGHQVRRSPMTPLFRLMLPKGIVGQNRGRFVTFNRFYVDGPAYGGLVGPAADAVRFLAMHVHGGALDGVRILSHETAAAMQAIQASGRGIDVGLGWYRRGADRSTRTHLEHLGGGGGFWNMMRLYPQQKLGVLAMGNATRYDHSIVADAARRATDPPAGS
jgi:CubicO group peptidase (beta-lactamase class C family)